MMSRSDFVQLYNGPTIPFVVCDWMAGAEVRGLRLRVELGGRLRVGPSDRVRPDDVSFLRDHREAIIATVAYLAAVDTSRVH